MLALLLGFASPVAAQSAACNQITILYDAFSDKSGFSLDWGYAALV
jgi:hypothetical protein